jgi:hypothetical protein
MLGGNMLTSSSFPIVAWRCFLAIVFSVPLVSLISLKREQQRIAAGSYRKPIAALFFAELWLWLIAAFIAGFILVSLLGFYVYVNAHSRATGSETVPPAPLILVFGGEVVLVFVGWLLHRFMKHLMH